MSNIYASYPVVGGGVPVYPTFANFPAGTSAGQLAVAADTGTLYEWNGSMWVAIAAPGDALSVGPFGTTPNADGLSITADVLQMQPASASFPGGVSTLTQSFAGNKTFTGTISASNLSGTNTGDVTLGTANGLSLSAQALSLGLSSTSTTGALSSTDWNTFNGKQPAGSYLVSTNNLSDVSSANTSLNNLLPSQTTNSGKFLTTNGTNTSWAPVTAGTVTSVSVVSANGLAGTVATATTTPAITLSTSVTGILQGNGTAISAATTGNLTDSGTDGITVTSGTGAVLGSGTSLSQHVSDTTHNGYLSSTDWNTFNNKGSGSVTSVSVVSANGLAGTVATATTTPALTLSTTVNSPVLAGNGTAISAASTTGTGSTVVLSTSPSITSATFLSTTTFPSSTSVTSAGILLVNTTAQTSPELIIAASSSTQSPHIAAQGYGFGGGNFVGMGANGTQASPTASLSGDGLSNISARGYGATGFPAHSRARISMFAAENWSDTAQGTYMTFQTTPTGSVTEAETARINSAGNFLSGTTSGNFYTNEQMTLLYPLTSPPSSTSAAFTGVLSLTSNSANSNVLKTMRLQSQRTTSGIVTDSAEIDCLQLGISISNGSNAYTNSGSAVALNIQSLATGATAPSLNYIAAQFSSDTVSVTGRKTSLYLAGMSGGTNNAFIADNQSFTGNFFINQSGTSANSFGGSVTIPNTGASALQIGTTSTLLTANEQVSNLYTITSPISANADAIVSQTNLTGNTASTNSSNGARFLSTRTTTASVTTDTVNIQGMISGVSLANASNTYTNSGLFSGIAVASLSVGATTPTINYTAIRVNSDSTSVTGTKTALYMLGMSGGTNNAFIADNQSFTGNFFINQSGTSTSFFGGNLTTGQAVSTQGYDTSTSTSGTITASANKPGLLITGAGGTTLTIKLPSSPIDGQQYWVASQAVFTTITWQDSGGTAGNVIGGQAAIGGATRGQTFVYSSAATKWFSIA